MSLLSDNHADQLTLASRYWLAVERSCIEHWSRILQGLRIAAILHTPAQSLAPWKNLANFTLDGHELSPLYWIHCFSFLDISYVPPVIRFVHLVYSTFTSAFIVPWNVHDTCSFSLKDNDWTMIFVFLLLILVNWYQELFKTVTKK